MFKLTKKLGKDMGNLLLSKKPSISGYRDNSRLNEVFKKQYINSIVVETNKLSDEEYKKIKNQLIEGDMSPLIGARFNIKERDKNIIIDTKGNVREKIKVTINTSNTEYFYTETYLTMGEINQLLNSKTDFINIGDVIVNRESVVEVYKLKENES